MEYVSGDGTEERDTTPDTGKFWVYENAIVAEFYVIFDPERATLDVHQRINARYQQLTPNAQGRFLIPPLGVELGIWVGNFRNLSGTWLRAWDPATDTLLPLDADRIETERQRANEQKKRADEQRQRADEQQKRADEQRERADAAEQRAARLAQLSRKARRGQASAEELLELEQLEQQIAPNGTA
jgi:multidrug efflux pump subunit AcrA (membrane-fusion protein)